MPLGWSSASFLLCVCVTDTRVSDGHSWERAVPSGMCSATQNQLSLDLLRSGSRVDCLGEGL